DRGPLGMVVNKRRHRRIIRVLLVIDRQPLIDAPLKALRPRLHRQETGHKNKQAEGKTHRIPLVSIGNTGYISGLWRQKRKNPNRGFCPRTSWWPKTARRALNMRLRKLMRLALSCAAPRSRCSAMANAV